MLYSTLANQEREKHFGGSPTTAPKVYNSITTPSDTFSSLQQRRALDYLMDDTINGRIREKKVTMDYLFLYRLERRIACRLRTSIFFGLHLTQFNMCCGFYISI
jgi:hypothetical protein